MKKKYQVFVSSTYEDLIDERKAISQALLECNCIPAGMELFPASNRKQWDIIKKVIDESDYYLLIVAGRYGSTCKNEEGEIISYTEMEYDYAHKQGKPIVAFICRDIDSLPMKFCEKTSVGKARLAKFIKKVSDNGGICHSCCIYLIFTYYCYVDCTVSEIQRCTGACHTVHIACCDRLT